MIQKVSIVIGLALSAVLLTSPAYADDDITIRIARHARLTADGDVTIRAFVRCGPLPGVEDFQEAHAGIGQARTGAGGEGGLDGAIVCDGVERAHTGRFSPLDQPFKAGPARANVSIIACRLVGDDQVQVCFSDSEARRVIITRRR
jgi:hypothetical protein